MHPDPKGIARWDLKKRPVKSSTTRMLELGRMFVTSPTTVICALLCGSCSVSGNQLANQAAAPQHLTTFQ